MDQKKVGAILDGAFSAHKEPVENLYVNEEFVGSLDNVVDTFPFLPSVMLIVPQPYRSRLGRRIDICGVVDKNTLEYESGARFFTSERVFLTDKGQLDDHSESTDDVVSVMTVSESNNSEKPLTPYIWVHPQHCTLTSFFSPLVPDKVYVSVGHYYINRMGFVVKIARGSSTPSPNAIYFDEEHRTYSVNGRVNDRIESMEDLIYEIRHWSVFSSNDWSGSRPITLPEMTDDGPEMFNPILNDRQALMTELLTITLRGHAIAKMLGIDFGFHINTDDRR